MHIRLEQAGDVNEIRKVNLEAFDTEAESKLVDGLRISGVNLISLVAEDEGEIVGHILFSPVTLEGHSDVNIAGLAPMAVLPDWQHKGVGSELVKNGIKACRESGYRAIVVLGHPGYYPRFGFSPAADFGLDSKYEVPREVFLALELENGALADISGTVAYNHLFNEV